MGLDYDKLVRDRIPEIIESSGKRAVTRVAGDDEYLHYLRRKLSEEVDEYMASEDAEELADILEVVSALGRQAGVPLSRLIEIADDKDAPPFLEELTTFLTKALFVEVNILTTSGIIAPAIVPHVIITESFHHKPFAKSPIMRLDVINVKTTDIIEVIQTKDVRGSSKFILSAFSYFDLAIEPFNQ